jgi:hypothetical protein
MALTTRALRAHTHTRERVLGWEDYIGERSVVKMGGICE